MDTVAVSLGSKKLNSNGKITWPEASLIKQSFSFPSSIIYNMAKNPLTPTSYLKLAKSCKYFFEKHPLLMVARIHTSGRLCSNPSFYQCDIKKKECCVLVDFQKLFAKIWLTFQLKLDHKYIPNFASSIVPKLYRCEKEAQFKARKTITFKDFKLYASHFQNYRLFYTRIIDNNDEENLIMLEEILGSIPVVKEFRCFHPAVNTSTLKNILKLPNLNSLRHLSLSDIPEISNIEDITTFIKNKTDTKIWLGFRKTISEQYESQLDQFIDTVIASEIPNLVIHYDGVNAEKYKIMTNRFYF